jgi:hypothetical protein
VTCIDNTGYQGNIVAIRVIENQSLGTGDVWTRLNNAARHVTRRIRCKERVAVCGCTLHGGLVEKGKLLNEPDCCHIGVMVCGLQMRHWCERVNAGYVVCPQQIRFQVRGHEERTL